MNTTLQARNGSATQSTELILFQVGGTGEPLMIVAKPPVGSDETSYSAWTADRKSVIYRRGEGHLFRQPTDGGSGAQVLVDSPGSTFRVMDVSRDGVVVVAKGSPQDDIQTFHLRTGVMSEFLATPAREIHGELLARRPVAGVHIERVWARRSLCPAVSMI